MFGDRGLNFEKRFSCVDLKHDLVAEVKFNPDKKGFFSIGK
jgi:hypothetical protein